MAVAVSILVALVTAWVRVGPPRAELAACKDKSVICFSPFWFSEIFCELFYCSPQVSCNNLQWTSCAKILNPAVEKLQVISSWSRRNPVNLSTDSNFDRINHWAAADLSQLLFIMINQKKIVIRIFEKKNKFCSWIRRTNNSSVSRVFICD